MNKKLIIIILLLNISLLYPISHSVRQLVRAWPVSYDATGVHWYVYDIYHPETHVLDENSIGSYTLYSAAQNAVRWTADVGNFPGQDWQEGDTIISFGVWDSAYVSDPSGYGANPNHTGFYWLFSDTLDADLDPQTLAPDDTLRPMPQPLAAQVGENIELSITNPVETSSGITTYGVLGYWLWADTTGSGTPDKYDKEVGFVPVQGGPGETTIYSHPIAGNYEAGQTVYWAYKLVALPDTTATCFRQTCPGYSTYYFSQNSNPLVVIGIEESQILNPQSQIPQLAVYPNPFKQLTEIRLQITDDRYQMTDDRTQIRIYDATGRLVKQFTQLLNDQLLNNQIVWDGTDDNGNCLPQGIYFLKLDCGNEVILRKVCRLK
jgi:hypothetical protein